MRTKLREELRAARLKIEKLYVTGVLVLLLGVAHFAGPRKVKFKVGDCFARVDETAQAVVTGVETYVYTVKWLTMPTDGASIEEKTGYIPIKIMDRDDRIFLIDCDVTTFGKKAN